MTSATQPTSVRQLETPAAKALGDLTAMLDDLQAVLYCCERLVTELARDEPDGLLIEAVWTTALLSYNRCFTNTGRGMALTEDDVSASKLQGDVLGWHKVLRQLRKHYANQVDNPRERFAVGLAQDDGGTVTGVAITSTHQPPLDELTVRQTGALAYQLGQLVEQRIGEQQERVLNAGTALSTADLDRLPLIDLSGDEPSEPA
jgi:hypothetical protein